MKQLLSNCRSHHAVHRNDLDRMRNDGDVKISCANPNHSPSQSVPDGDPVEVMESIHHERIECKYQYVGDKGKRRVTSGQFGSPSLRFKCSQPSEEKSAKIQLNKEGDATDEPGDHDQEGKSAMQRGFEEIDVIAQMRIGRGNHERIQAAEQQACQESPAQAILDFSFFSPN